MTTTFAQYEPGQSGSYDNYSLVFNSSAASSFSSLNLSCTSYDPYYPGVGADFFVPCQSANSSSTGGGILIVDHLTDRLVGQISLTGFSTSWFAPEGLAWDSLDGLLYACNDVSGTLLALNTTADSDIYDVAIPGGCAWVVYDVSANALLVSGTYPYGGTGDGLNVVNPATGQIRETLFTERTSLGGGEVTAGVANAADGWVALGIASSANPAVGSVMVVNSSNFAPISNIALTPGEGSAFSVPYQILLDPSHGDIYSITSAGLFAINDTQYLVLTEVGIPTQLVDFSAIYLSSTDSVYLSSEGSIVTVSLTHATSQELTEVLWLPAPEGILAIAGASGALVAVAVYLRRSNRLRRSP